MKNRFEIVAKKYCIVIFVLLFFWSSSVLGVTKTAKASGSTKAWNTAGCWQPSGVPVAGDDIIIPTGLDFQLNNTTTRDYNSLTIQSGASLTSTTTSRLIIRTSLVNNGTLSMTALGVYPNSTFSIQPSYTCIISGSGTFEFGNIFTSASSGILRFNFSTSRNIDIYGSINSGGSTSKFNDDQKTNFTLTFKGTGGDQNINVDDDFDYPNIIVNKGSDHLIATGSGGTMEVYGTLTCTSSTDVFQINDLVTLLGDFSGSGYISAGTATPSTPVLTLAGSSASDNLSFADNTIFRQFLISRTNSAITYTTLSSPANLTVLDYLEIGANSSLSIGTGTLNIGNDIYNDFGLLSMGSGATFIGSSTSNLTIRTSDIGELYFSQASSASQTLNSLYIETQSYQWSLNTNLNIVDFIELGPTTLFDIASGNTLTLLSTSSSTARVAPIIDESSLTGNVSVQRWVQGGYRSSRLMSSPVNTGGTYNLAEYKNYIYVTGIGGSTNGFDTYTNYTINGVTIGKYVQTTASQPDITSGITNINTTVEPGEGYIVFIRGNRTDPVGKLFSPYATPEAVTLAFTGTLNAGDYTVDVPYLSGNLTTNGFTAVGNPYASAISWNSVDLIKTNIETRMWVYNPVNKQYGIWDGANGNNGATDVIASGQGFLVKAIASNANISFTETVKTTNTGVMQLLNTKDEGPVLSSQYSSKPTTSAVNTSKFKFRLVRSGTADYDEVVIAFNNTSKKEYTSEDGIDIESSDLRLSSLSEDGRRLGINYLPLLAEDEQIKLYVNASLSGDYSLRFDQVPSLNNATAVLKDNYTNTETVLSSGFVYPFSINLTSTALKDATTGAQRFSIFIKKIIPPSIVLSSFTADKEPSGIKLHWKTTSEFNNKFFILQKAYGNNVFSDLVSIPSTSVNGNGADYSYLDKNPFEGINYYRLKQVDNAEVLSFSKTVSIDWLVTKTNDKINMFPVPAKDNVTINFTKWAGKELNLTFYTTTGVLTKKVHLNTVQNVGSYSTDLSNFAPGVYVIEVKEQMSGEAERIKFIKQ